MNIGEKLKHSNASDDLTVVLLRGNGSPRSFRVSLPALHRSLTAIGFLFALALFTALVLAGLWLVRGFGFPSSVPVTPPVAQAPSSEPVATAVPGEQPTPGTNGLWQKLKGSVETGASDNELQKEVQGLREEIAKLGARVDERKTLEPGTSPLLQFFGPKSSLVPESQTSMRIKNPRVTRDPDSKQMVVRFELHNVDPQQTQQRGYIVAIAKAPDILLTYPANVLKPNDNVLLDFTRGETFGVSRFREAQATFPLSLLENRKVSYQILLFAHDGRVIGNTHVESSK